MCHSFTWLHAPGALWAGVPKSPSDVGAPRIVSSINVFPVPADQLLESLYLQSELLLLWYAATSPSTLVVTAVGGPCLLHGTRTRGRIEVA